MADEWNLNVPDNDELVSDLPGEHRERKTNVKAVIEVEHTALGDGNSGGLHKQGSARAFFQDAAPGTNVDGSAFGAGDLGLLWIDSNASPDNQFNILTATTPTWTPISTEIIAFLLAANRQFAGNVIVDGTLTSTGVATLADTSALATSGAPAADAQIANKKYVDDNVGRANWTPVSYAAEESVTFPNGLIIKFGNDSVTTGDTITFGTAFPNSLISVFVTLSTTTGTKSVSVSVQSTTIFKIHHNVGAAVLVNWIAVGY